MDGNWKLCYPICTFKVKKEVTGFDGALKYVDSCPNQPESGMAFCTEHYKKADSLEIPTKLREFLKSKMVCVFYHTYLMYIILGQCSTFS